VQEDTENCSVGQMIISHLAIRPDVWSRLVSPPLLVSKGNVMIGYNPIYEYAALPDPNRIVEAIHRALNGILPRAVADATRTLPAAAPPEPASAVVSPSTGEGTAATDVPINVPIMGEGIRAVRIVALLKQPGEPVAADETLCEVETDKAVYPVESAFAGTLKAWRCRPNDVLNVGAELAVITTPVARQTALAKPPAPPRAVAEPPPAERAPQSVVPPALSPAITRRLTGVVPANMQLDAAWQAIRTARVQARERGLDFTPSLMLAWCTTRAMERHAAFRRVVLKDGGIAQHESFDLGIAVALEGDRLATAAIHAAPKFDWPGFVRAYADAIAAVRAGKVEDVQAPLNITSLGAFGVEVATPIVVPPAMSTLFIGATRERMINADGVVYPAEVVTLSLTFDHRVVNGAGAAAFLQDLKKRIEGFALPER